MLQNRRLLDERDAARAALADAEQELGEAVDLAETRSLLLGQATTKLEVMRLAETRRIIHIKELERLLDLGNAQLSRRYCPTQTAQCADCRATVVVMR